ncbi:basic salivary proline-rich protein 4-like [Periplaneta americana]|uniref:basic salivary proline-rich protein 4-like n=1 Tax=Periplaneta americana TaxID=6978 RepID=UPI0037E9B58A
MVYNGFQSMNCHHFIMHASTLQIVLLSAMATVQAAVPVLLGSSNLYPTPAAPPILHLASPSYSLEVPYPASRTALAPAVYPRVYSDASRGSFIVVSDERPPAFLHNSFEDIYARSFSTSSPRNYQGGFETFSRRQGEILNRFEHPRLRGEGHDSGLTQGFQQPPPGVEGRSFGGRLPHGGPSGPGAFGPPGHPSGGPGGPEARGRAFESGPGGRSGPGGFHQPPGPPAGPGAGGQTFRPPPSTRSGLHQQGPPGLQGVPDSRSQGGFQQPPGGPGDHPFGPQQHGSRGPQSERRPEIQPPHGPPPGIPTGPGRQHSVSVNFEAPGYDFGYSVSGDTARRPPQGPGFPPSVGPSQSSPPPFSRPNSEH